MWIWLKCAAKNIKNIKFVAIRYVLSSSICTNTPLSAGTPPRTHRRWESLRCSSSLPSRLGGEYPPHTLSTRRLRRLDLSASVRRPSNQNSWLCLCSQRWEIFLLFISPSPTPFLLVWSPLLNQLAAHPPPDPGRAQLSSVLMHFEVNKLLTFVK